MTVDPTTLRSYHALAQSRAEGRVVRAACYLFGASIGLLFAPGWLAAACVAAIAVAELVEWRCVERVLRTGEAGRVASTGPRDITRFRLALVGTDFMVALGLGVIWVFAAPANPVLPFCLFVIPLIGILHAGHRVAGLMLVRQAIYLAVLIAMVGRDLLADGLPGTVALLTGGLPVLLLAAITLAVTHARGKSYAVWLDREREMADARLRTTREAEAKNRFIATVSHELRTSLNGVLGMAQTLLGSNLDPRQRQQAEVIVESGRSLNTLLNDILDNSKLEVGKLSIERRPEDLRQSVEHIAWLHGAVASQKGIELRVQVAPDVPARLMIDAVRIRQCLSNLVSNAIKFTEQGSVEISVSSEPRGATARRPDGYMVTVIVADTGIGIAPDRAETLFQPFAQADRTISRRFGGTGLGLSITRQLAEAMGGAVTLESTPGAGTTFRFSFHAESAPKSDAGDGAPSALDLADQRILIADDVATNRVVMRLLLAPLGVEIVEVSDGGAALAALEQGRFDAAFLDINMPGLGGDAIVRRLRDGRGRDIALVAISGDSSAERIDTGIGGFDGVVTKPIDPDALKHILLRALRRRGARGSEHGRSG